MAIHDEYQFYPTPISLALKAWKKFKDRDFVRVLEPSAGEGHLASVEHFGRHRIIDVDCIEVDISKHATLRSKGHEVVGLDFMEFEGGSMYSHIIMNPPFSQGAHHVLKAWDILYEGEIVAILNAETIRNPFSKERRLLVDLIERHGEVEYLTETFAGEDAERKTSVEIALVYMKKEGAFQFDLVGNILDQLKEETETKESLAGEFKELNEIALTSSMIENAVVRFNAAWLAIKQAVFAEARARHYCNTIGSTMEMMHSASHDECSLKWVQKTMQERFSELKNRAWANILRSTDVTSRLSSAAQKRIESEFSEIQKLQFTVANIYGFLHGLIQSRGEIQIGMVCDVFDLITRYHADNNVYYLGWVSNSKHRTAGMRIKMSRFIIPGNSSYSHCLCWESTQMLRDFDKVFALLDGKTQPEISLEQVFHDHYKDLRQGERISSTYFDVRFYPGRGTIHFFPKNRTLIDRLNRMVGAHRQWLPEPSETVNEQFWLQYENAEKFDKEVRAAVSKMSRNYWDEPYRALNWNNNPDEQEKAHEKVTNAIMDTLEKNGYDVGNLLAGPERLKIAA